MQKTTCKNTKFVGLKLQCKICYILNSYLFCKNRIAQINAKNNDKKQQNVHYPFANRNYSISRKQHKKSNLIFTFYAIK